MLGCVYALPWLASATSILAAAYFFLGRKRVSLIGLIFFAIPTAVGVAGSAYQFFDDRASEAASQRYVAANTRIVTKRTTYHGISLPAGTTFFQDPDAKENATVTVPHPIDAAGVPVTGAFEIADHGLDGTVKLARDATVEGFSCAATSEVKFRDGKLVSCTLRKMRVVDGIPCGGDFERDEILSCTLATPYRASALVFPAGTTWIQSGHNDADILLPGDRSALVFLGRPLAHGNLHLQTDGRITVEIQRLTYRGCDVEWGFVTADGDVRLKGERCYVSAPRGSLVIPR